MIKKQVRQKGRVDLTTLSELGLRRLELSEITISESCSKSPAVIISQEGEVITILKYNDLKAVVEFIQQVLNHDK